MVATLTVEGINWWLPVVVSERARRSEAYILAAALHIQEFTPFEHMDFREACSEKAQFPNWVTKFKLLRMNITI
jgi:hypothetical protein